MSIDNIVEAFVSTIMLGVMLVIMVYIWNPEIGQVLVGILPAFVEVVVYLLVGVVLVAMIYQAVE